ncbi:MAG: helix-turn-helix domain-containing protein [Archangium sp.]|nr:helix-turn-helix domain-containing protein [Archangium sp.]
MSGILSNRLRKTRQARGLTQQELASRVGISRQSLNALESGRSVPGTDVALELASALGERVDVLFSLAGVKRVSATFPGRRLRNGDRVALADVDGRWIAHAVEHTDGLAADGVVVSGQVRPFDRLDRARRRLVVMGCAPALSVLASRLGDDHGLPLTWVRGSSGASLSALARGEVHVAGIHLEENVIEVMRRFPRQSMRVVNLVTWEQGLLVGEGNPLRIRRLGDALTPKVRWVRREPDSGAERLLRSLARDKMPLGGALATGHLEVAQRIALGAADAGIGIRAAAIAFGLPFIPLTEERFDLVFHDRLAQDDRMERLVDTVAGSPFKRELAALGGYQTAASGHEVGVP